MIDQIMNQIGQIDNLYTDSKIDVSDFIKEIRYSEEENKVQLVIKRLGEDESKNQQIQREVVRKLKIDLKLNGAKVMYPFKKIEKEKTSKEELFPQTRVIAIISGKGGVGKSQVTYNLAKTLQKSGKKVGIVDADIYGYSIQKIANQYEQMKQTDDKIIPLVDQFGIEIMSTQHFINQNQNEAVVWRGPMLNKMLNNFFKFIDFSKNLDFLLIDMPPGTGDVMLNLPGYFSELETLLVTTPHADSAHVAIRSAKLAMQLKMKLIGVVENMSYLMLDNKKHYIFGQNGGANISRELKTPLLIQLPFNNAEDNETRESVRIQEEKYQELSEKIFKSTKN